MKQRKGFWPRAAVWALVLVVGLLPLRAAVYGAEEDAAAVRGAGGEGRPFEEYFPGEGLARAVAQQLGKDVSENVTQEELNSITYFSLIYSGALDSLEGIDSLQNCTSLHLDNNKLDSLHDSLFNMEQLQSLSIKNNPIGDLSDGIGNLINLDNLIITGANLTSLPDSMAALQNLISVDLSSNQLTFLPEWFGDLTFLRRLDLSQNELTVFPEAIKSLDNLETLSLRFNNIQELPDGWLAEYTGIVYLGDYDYYAGDVHIPDSQIPFEEVFPDLLWKLMSYEYPLDSEWSLYIELYDRWEDNDQTRFYDSLPSHHDIPAGQYDVFTQFGSINSSMASVYYTLFQRWTVGAFAPQPPPYTVYLTEKFTDESQPERTTEYVVEEAGPYQVTIPVPPGYSLHDIRYEGRGDWYWMDEDANIVASKRVDRDEYLFATYAPTGQQTDHTVTVISRYRDGALPEKTKTYQVADGERFEERYEVLEGYGVAGSMVMSLEYGVDEGNQLVYIDPVTQDHTIVLEFAPKQHDVSVTTRYRDGALPEETQTYRVAHGTRFEEYYDVLDGYGVGGFMVRNLEYGVDEDSRMIYIDPVTQDHNILIEFVPLSHTFMITTRFQDGSQEDVVEVYDDLPHGEPFDATFEVPAGYRVRGVQSGSLGIMVDWYAYSVHVDSMTKNMSITILLNT